MKTFHQLRKSSQFCTSTSVWYHWVPLHPCSTLPTWNQPPLTLVCLCSGRKNYWCQWTNPSLQTALVALPRSGKPKSQEWKQLPYTWQHYNMFACSRLTNHYFSCSINFDNPIAKLFYEAIFIRPVMKHCYSMVRINNSAQHMHIWLHAEKCL